VLGGEAAHGVLVLSPRAVARANSYTPPWPVPKILRLKDGSKFSAELFNGVVINTISMLCLEDYILSLRWAKEGGGVAALRARCRANVAALEEFVGGQGCWLKFLAVLKGGGGGLSGG
jgi:phosphoserine aminotransferase